MEFDKSWTKIRNRAKSQEFWNGLKAFINRVRPFVNDRGKIRCPCNKCLNGLTHSLETVEAHIFRYGFAESYITWIHHGEIEIPCESVNAQKNMVNRSHAKYPSVQGSNSFFATRYEKIDPETKQLPSPIDCFKEFHTFKSGNLVNTNATVNYGDSTNSILLSY